MASAITDPNRAETVCAAGELMEHVRLASRIQPIDGSATIDAVAIAAQERRAVEVSNFVPQEATAGLERSDGKLGGKIKQHGFFARRRDLEYDTVVICPAFRCAIQVAGLIENHTPNGNASIGAIKAE